MGSLSGKTVMQAGKEGRQGTATMQIRERKAGRQPWKVRRQGKQVGKVTRGRNAHNTGK